MTPFEFFGLDESADERTIKRAYAARLRATRPEQDPASFQRLNAAYKAALNVCHARAWHAAQARKAATPDAESVAGAAGGPHIDPDPASATTTAAEQPRTATPDDTPRTPPSPYDGRALRDRAAKYRSAQTLAPPQELAPAPFDFARFFAAMAAAACGSSGAEFGQWLQREPAFWSLAQKSAVRQIVLERLNAQRTPMRADCFDALLAFFDLDHVLAGLDAFAVQRLRRQLHLAWELLPQNFGHLAARMRRSPPVVASDAELRRLLDEARRPLRWRALLLRAGRRTFAAHFAAFAHRLSFGQPDELPPEFDHGTIRFWTEAANVAQPTWRTIALAFVNWAPWLLLGLALCAWSRLAPNDAEAPVRLIWGVLVAALGGSQLTLLVWRATVHWLLQRSARDDPAWRFWFRLGALPALAVLGAALETVSLPLSAALALIALVLAFSCVRVLTPTPMSLGRSLYLLGCCVGMGLVFPFLFGTFVQWIAVITLAWWAVCCKARRLHRRQ